MEQTFMCVTKKELEARGISRPDFVLVTGDAYVDHPSFGISLIGRYLEHLGYSVGIIARPDLNEKHSFSEFGEPALSFLVTSGNIDSMVANYTASKKKRSDDPYAPGNRAGRRPDRAALVYSRAVKKEYPGAAVVLGGLEASLRRFAHYDYWENTVRPSELFSSGADLLVYGMGERAMKEIARRLRAGETIDSIRDVRGTCALSSEAPSGGDFILLPSFEEISSDKRKYNEAVKSEHLNQDHLTGKALVQPHGARFLIQNPPEAPLMTPEMDEIYDLPYARAVHPMYEREGEVKAIEEVEFSILSSRGCFGGCNFCSLTFHQGRRVSARSHDSILREARGFLKNPRFKGYIHDVGGPTANFRQNACKRQEKHGVCLGKSCLAPRRCKELLVDHKDYLSLLRKLRALEGVKKVFVRSGIRFDYILADKDDTFFRELVEHHISGQLKVAPEHASERVLSAMGKPEFDTYRRFAQKYASLNKKLGKRQYLVPYLISSHPGSNLDDAIFLAQYLKSVGFCPEQVQDFYPTPGTLSTAMFYTGRHPLTGEEVFVPRTAEEKAAQRALLQYKLPKNREIIRRALKKAGREDLIGFQKDALIAPYERKSRGGAFSPPTKKGMSGAAREQGKKSGRKK